jgi:hypothetical protein
MNAKMHKLIGMLQAMAIEIGAFTIAITAVVLFIAALVAPFGCKPAAPTPAPTMWAAWEGVVAQDSSGQERQIMLGLEAGGAVRWQLGGVIEAEWMTEGMDTEAGGQ